MKKGLLVAMVCFIGFGAAKAQIKIDVKTDLRVKAQYSIIKTAIVMAINSSSHFETTETGEDYSFWITNIKRRQYSGRNYIDVYFQIRTPSFFTKGDLISKGSLTKDYDPELIKNAYNLTDLKNRITLLARGKEYALKLSNKKSIAYSAASVEPISGIAVWILQMLSKKYLGNVNLQQTNIRLSEATLIGEKVTNYLVNYLR